MKLLGPNLTKEKQSPDPGERSAINFSTQMRKSKALLFLISSYVHDPSLSVL